MPRPRSEKLQASIDRHREIVGLAIDRKPRNAQGETTIAQESWWTRHGLSYAEFAELARQQLRRMAPHSKIVSDRHPVF